MKIRQITILSFAKEAIKQTAYSPLSLRINLFSSPNPSKFSPTSEAEIIARNLRAESHVIGWIYLSLGLTVGVIVMFAFRCKSKYSYEQSNYITRYSAGAADLYSVFVRQSFLHINFYVHKRMRKYVCFCCVI